MQRPQLLHMSLPLTALSLIGCGTQPECVGDRCETAIIVAANDADVLIPPVTAQSVSRSITDLIFLKLADIGPSLNTVGDGDFSPRLAESWAFEDSVTVSFNLNPEARWHDGEPVRSNDVVFTFRLYTDPLVASPFAPLLSSIDSVTARNDQTAVFHFSRAYPEQFYDATHHLRVLPVHLLGAVQSEELHNHPFGSEPVGNGPYQFAEWRRGEVLELVADSLFFLGEPALKRLVWQIVPDEGALVALLLADQADIAEAVLIPENLERIRSAEHLRLVDYPAPAYGYIGFNFRSPDEPDRPHPIFSDRELRRALALATDRQAIVDAALGGNGNVPVGPTGRAVWIWSEEISQIPFDTVEARSALARSGWSDSDGDGVLDRAGRPLEFELLVPSSSGVRRRSAVIFQDQLRRVGVSMSIQEVEFNTFLDRATTGRFDAVFGAFALDPSPRGITQLWTTDGIGQSNWGSYSNPEFDHLVASALETRDRAAAERIWHEALGVINEDAAAIWIFEPQLSAVVHSRFDEVSVRPDQWVADLWKWQLRN